MEASYIPNNPQFGLQVECNWTGPSAEIQQANNCTDDLSSCWSEDMGSFSLPLDLEPLPSLFNISPCSNSTNGSYKMTFLRTFARNFMKWHISKPKLVARNTHSHGTKQACSKTTTTTLMEPGCKVAVITGGTEGIGFATAHQLLCCKAKHVALLDQDIPKGFEAVNNLNCSHGKNKATFIKCDVSNQEAVEDTFLKLKNEFKTVDIIVNAAGVWDETKWQQQLKTNLVGTVNVNLAVQKCFEGSETVVVNLAGLSGLQPSSCSPINAAEYSGVVRLSQSLGHQVNSRRTGIRVVALCVGITSTNFIKDVHKKMLTTEMGKDLQEEMKTAVCQRAEAGAKAVLEVVRRAATGSVWVVEGSRLLHVNMADWRKSCTLESQFTIESSLANHQTPLTFRDSKQPSDAADVLLSLKHAVVHPDDRFDACHPHQMLLSPSGGYGAGGCEQAFGAQPAAMFPSMSVNVSMNMTMHGYHPNNGCVNGYPAAEITCPQVQWSATPQIGGHHHHHHQAYHNQGLLSPTYGGATYSFTADFRPPPPPPEGVASLAASYKPAPAAFPSPRRRHSLGLLEEDCQKPNVCRICGKSYARPSTLKTHLRTHSGEKPYRCADCAKSFSQAANLTAHARTHSGEKPFRCPVCDRRFSQSSSVTTHMRTHSGERPYRCRLCKKAFSDSSTLTKHLRIHSGEKPYECKLCLLRFSQSGNLNRHMRVHGGSGMPP